METRAASAIVLHVCADMGEVGGHVLTVVHFLAEACLVSSPVFLRKPAGCLG